MRKLLIFILMALCCFPVFADTIYEIETSHGPQQIVIPDGYTDKDVLLIIAKAYYELSWDFDELTEKSQKLAEDVEVYLEENKKLQVQYEELTLSYQELVDKMSELTKRTPVAAIAGLGFGYYSKEPYFSVNLGVELFEKFSLITSLHLIDMQPAIGIGVNYHF